MHTYAEADHEASVFSILTFVAKLASSLANFWAHNKTVFN